MTRVFEDQTFEGFHDRGSARTFSDLVFRRCVFVHCDISITGNPALRTTVRRVQLIDCVRKHDPAGLSCPIIEDCLVENLKTEGLFLIWGAAFKHVVLRGRIGEVMISDRIAPLMEVTDLDLQAFSEANRFYYATVDWALDISQAEFGDCDIRGMPAHLIRRDPETQVVVCRQKALQGHWKELDLSKTYWPTAIEFMLEREDADAVLVAPKRAPNFTDLLAGLDLLRKAGVAEPD